LVRISQNETSHSFGIGSWDEFMHILKNKKDEQISKITQGAKDY